MSKPVVRFGIAGLGAISRRHLEIVAGAEGTALTALCDADATRLDAAEREWTSRVPGVQCFESFGAMLAARCCDVVTLCTPSGLHGSMIEDAAAAGIHVLCEKPLEVTLSKADAALRACQKARVRIGVLYQRRGLRLFREMADAVTAERLGPLAMASASVKWYRPSSYYGDSWHGTFVLEGGGAIANQAVHALDAIQWVAGGVEAVMARVATRAHPVEVEDTAAVVLRYCNGAIGTLEAATSSYPGEPMTFSLHGPEGTILISNEKILKWVEHGLDRTQAMQEQQAQWPETADRFGGHRALILDMAEAVRSGRDPICNGLAGRESVALMEAIYASARTGRETQVAPAPSDLADV